MSSTFAEQDEREFFFDDLKCVLDYPIVVFWNLFLTFELLLFLILLR